MGFTLSRHGSSTVSALRSPEKEAADKLNHDHMKRIAIDPPITIGSPKQISWAKSIASQFLFYAHAWSFKAEQIDRVFAEKGKYAKFWIDNKPSHPMSGELRVAVENLLAEMDADRAALAKSQAAIARLSKQQINKMIGRGL